MQEEKNRTTPEQQKINKKRRRRRKKTGAPTQRTVMRPSGTEEKTAAAAEPNPENPAQDARDQDASAVQPTEPMEKELPEKPEQPEIAQTPEEAAPASDTEAETTEASAAKPEEPAPEAETAQSSEEVRTPEPEVVPQETVTGPGQDVQTPETAEPEPTTEAPDKAAEVPPENDGPQAEETASAEEETAGTEPSEPEEFVAETVGEKTAPEPEESQSPSDAETEGQGSETPEAEEPEAPEEPEEIDEPEEEIPEEDEKRISDMTRTVQLSIEQIMARAGEESAAGTEEAPQQPESAEEPEESDTPATLQDWLRSGLSGMAKWMLLVLFVVLVIAGCGVAWLYRSATPDMLPQITVQFAGQTLEPTAYKWKVPVIGNVFKRTYADTLSSTPVELEATVEQASPDFVVSPSDYRTELTVTDSEENVIFEGDVDTFSTFQFTANGTYTAKLVVHSDASSVPGDTSVTGSETWQFSFTVGVRPSIRLSSTTAAQGSVVAVRVGDTLDGQEPTIQTSLANAGFFKASSGWVCYLPIPWNQSTAQSQSLVVTAGGYTETFDLKISAAGWEYKDYSRESQRVSPYIGEKDIPAELQKLLTQSEETIAWSNGNFVQPFLNTLDIKLAFGTTEYVGRSYSERSTNNGAGGRTVTNMVLDTTSGELLIAPASGTVVLAKDLGGDFGYTLVIDHGAGVKSIFYNLQKINVKTGSAVKQGQTLASCGKTTVAEMRIGTVPIDPLQVWRGQCDALKYY